MTIFFKPEGRDPTMENTELLPFRNRPLEYSSEPVRAAWADVVSDLL
jgi:hypothetical protein